MFCAVGFGTDFVDSNSTELIPPKCLVVAIPYIGTILNE